jgi:hypothetical protein
MVAMAIIESFEDVRGLTEAELHLLLERGRPEERVWAIWALALRSTEPGAEADLLGQRAEPAPGVRRNFAVVLAGHGQYDLLVALAKRDPEPVVRAAAMQLVTRIAIDGRLSPTIVAERMSADGAEVKLAVLGTIFEGAPIWLVDLAETLLEDRDADCRYEAFEALVRAGREAQALMWLEEAPETEARLALMRWSARVRVGPCAIALSSASRRLRRLLIETVRVVSWHELAPVVGDEPALLRTLAGRAPHIVEQMPLNALVRAALREARDLWVTAIASRLASLAAPDADVAPLLPELCELCTQRITQIDVATEELRGDDDPQLVIEREQLSDARAIYERALDHALRLVVH